MIDCVQRSVMHLHELIEGVADIAVAVIGDSGILVRDLHGLHIDLDHHIRLMMQAV